MFVEKMYVRCPADYESDTDPRIFVCGQIIAIDDFKQTLSVKIHDPFNTLEFFDALPRGTIEVPMSQATHCSMFIGSMMITKHETCRVLSSHTTKDGLYWYYVQSLKTKNVFKVEERMITAAFNNGRIYPSEQLEMYEFQNPCWYFGHAVVSRSMNVLENSIYGFKQLAGSKIYLLPHQVNSIMRCLQGKPCRYMLADEVGMGKTIEAISIIKIFLQNCVKASVLFVVPETLKEQWKTELLLKFGISIGKDQDNNRVAIKSVRELDVIDAAFPWSFVVVDEVHGNLENQSDYKMLHDISKVAENVLLLSATPVQQRKDEYLALLRLLDPQKYDAFDAQAFSSLVEKQSSIIQKTALVLDDLADYEEEISKVGEAAHNSEDCADIFDEILEDLKELCDALNDEKLSALLADAKFDRDDLGVYPIKVVISYICSNYQIESNVIRNRRKILEANDEGTRLLPVRQMQEASYPLDPEANTYECNCYQLIVEWLTEYRDQIDIERVGKPLLCAFFSSSCAFLAELRRQQTSGIELNPELITSAENWVKDEEGILNDVVDILDDPETYAADCASRLITVMNLLSEELYDQKVVLFTNYKETFDIYWHAIKKVFKDNEVSFFGEGMNTDEIELNAYRFQNEDQCHMMLCDSTGGEGRNFQCADYLVHIDLPWDASAIEQRIGRLDRLERDPARPIVHSVVIHTENTFESALFSFFDQGLKIFTQSLSGMEIIMKDVNEQIISAVKSDFKYGLEERITQINRLADHMRETIRKEQNFDAAGFMFRPMYLELKRLIDYYSRNENELFASAMADWASLAGFHGYRNHDEGIITYSSESFSPKSAMNSQLIPPRWSDYLNTRQNKFLGEVQSAYDRQTRNQWMDRSIRGTFIRKRAIENDYLHFFAPGDDAFDHIVNNAICSCKGCSSAFAIKAGIEWQGIVFTWTVAPNEAYLLDQGISIYALSPYRNYLMSEQVVIPVSLENPDAASNEEVISEYLRLINTSFVKSSVVHLGKRSHGSSFVQDIPEDQTNLQWFKDRYVAEEWHKIIELARKESFDQALEQFKRRSNIRGAKEEMSRVLSARAANSAFYETGQEKLEQLKLELQCVLDALRKPVITLDSVAYIWMVKNTDE